MRFMVLAGVVVLAGCAATADQIVQEPATIRGNYQQIAACVYESLDPMSPGNFRLTDLRGSSKIVITFETSGGGMTFRDLEATFSRVSDDITALDVKGRPPGYYPNKVRPLAEDCAMKRQKPA